MAFDKESFLAGLAVGRTLWQPPKIDEGFSALRSVSAESEPEQEEQEQEENAV